VKVRYSEGVAIHTDPESCPGHCREAVREALIGGRTGEVLSGESNVVRGADAVLVPTATILRHHFTSDDQCIFW
jgi:hypothetical protein